MITDQQGFDLLIPVYNEGINIIKLLKYIKNSSNLVAKIYICYDFDDDSSVHAINNSEYKNNQNVILLKNFDKGPCDAIKTGISCSKSQVVVIYPADDFHNGLLLDKMYDLFLQGYDIICPSRFMKGGSMKNCPLLKYLIVNYYQYNINN